MMMMMVVMMISEKLLSSSVPQFKSGTNGLQCLAFASSHFLSLKSCALTLDLALHSSSLPGTIANVLIKKSAGL